MQCESTWMVFASSSISGSEEHRRDAMQSDNLGFPGLGFVFTFLCTGIHSEKHLCLQAQISLSDSKKSKNIFVFFLQTCDVYAFTIVFSNLEIHFVGWNNLKFDFFFYGQLFQEAKMTSRQATPVFQSILSTINVYLKINDHQIQSPLSDIYFGDICHGIVHNSKFECYKCQPDPEEL